MIPSAAAVVLDAQGRLLLVRRGRAPAAGLWSIPGGKCLPGEPAATACAREVAEETGLVVRVGRLLGVVRRPGPDDATYVISDFACTAVGGRLRAGDDADDARWVDRAGFDRLPLVPLLAETLAGWGCLPRT